MNVFWDSNCVAPWDCWSICYLECMLATPSNQTPEAWHRDLRRKKIPGMFKASTSFVVNKTLPQLALIDGLAIPNVLNFEVTMHSQKKQHTICHTIWSISIVWQTILSY